jgi:hypothetical protein
MNRRSFLSAGAATASAMAIPALLWPDTASASVLPPVSKSDTDTVTRVFTVIKNNLDKNLCSPLNLEAGAAVMSMMVGNLNRSGFNAQFTPQLKAGTLNLIRTGADGSARVRSNLATNGVQITSNQAELYFRPTNAAMQSFVSGLSSPGLTTMELDWSARLDTVAHAMQAAGITDISKTVDLPKAHLLRVGCAADGLAFGVLALLSPPPLDVVFGIAGVVYGILDVVFARACEQGFPDPGTGE